MTEILCLSTVVAVMVFVALHRRSHWCTKETDVLTSSEGINYALLRRPVCYPLGNDRCIQFVKCILQCQRPPVAQDQRVIPLVDENGGRRLPFRGDFPVDPAGVEDTQDDGMFRL